MFNHGQQEIWRKLTEEEIHYPSKNSGVESNRPRVAVVIDHNGDVLLWKDAPYYRGRGRGKGKRTV